MSDKSTFLTSEALAKISRQMEPAISFRSSSKDGEELPLRIKFLDWEENKGCTTGTTACLVDFLCLEGLVILLESELGPPHPAYNCDYEFHRAQR